MRAYEKRSETSRVLEVHSKLFGMAGKRGPGFSCQADLETTLALPDLLERLAQQIRKDGMDA